MNKNIITFVFQSGRTSRINNEKEEFSKEFFYSYQSFKAEFSSVNLIEFENPNSFFNILTSPIFRALRYLTTIPFYCEYIQSVKNFKILFNSDEIIFTNQRVAFSSMPMLLLSSLLRKNKSTVFIMGLFVEQSKNSVRKFFRINFIKLLVKISNNLIFLSSSEKEVATSIFPKHKEKMFFLPFPVDNEFWNKIIGFFHFFSMGALAVIISGQEALVLVGHGLNLLSELSIGLGEACNGFL